MRTSRCRTVGSCLDELDVERVRRRRGAPDVRGPTFHAKRVGVQVARQIGWHLVVPLLRLRARRRLHDLRPGEVTVVTVNWSSLPFLEVLLRTVQRRSPATTRVVVVDNGSSDGSRSALRGRADVRTVALPLNVGHDLALDIGFLQADTEFVVALDVDAFPLHDRWLEELLEPLRSGCEISGAHLNRAYVHPCCLAMRTERFVRRAHSFRSRYVPRSPGRDASGEVGEEMSAREQGRLHFFEPTSRRGPSDVGTVFGDLVYHNFYATRPHNLSHEPTEEGLTRSDPAAAWQEALERYDV